MRLQDIDAETGIVTITMPDNVRVYETAEAHLADCHEFLNSIPSLDDRVRLWGTLKASLKQLDRIAINRQAYAVLSHDFAPLSFNFSIGNFCGGLIFHGHGVGGGSYPTLAVTLDDSDGWRIHT